MYKNNSQSTTQADVMLHAYNSITSEPCVCWWLCLHNEPASSSCRLPHMLLLLKWSTHVIVFVNPCVHSEATLG